MKVTYVIDIVKKNNLPIWQKLTLSLRVLHIEI